MPVLTARKAARLRQQTGDPRYRSIHDLDTTPLWRVLRDAAIKPFVMLAQEPMLVAMCVARRRPFF